jgi:beta-glucosidase/6-phospho-beta-glucosidase/beta-galactosidase
LFGSRHLVCLVATAVLLLTVALAPAASARQAFPRGFLWGTATAGFQVEAGGARANSDRRSDWWAFTTDPELIGTGVVSGDRVDRGPGFWQTWPADLDRARKRLGSNAIRLGVEWSRIFPRSTASIRTGRRIGRADLRRLDRAADARAVRRYRRIIRGARRRGMRVLLTLNHYTLPIWVHDPRAVRHAFAGVGPADPVPAGLRRAGWLSRSTVAEFRKYAAFAALKFGGDVGLWATLNEPLVTVSQGFVSIPGVTGVKAPAVLSYTAALRALENLGLANAAAYDAIKAADRHARVGFVHNMVAWRPSDPSSAADVGAARHADQLFNRAWLDLAVRGINDSDADGVEDPGERRHRLAGKADFVGVNHYSPGRVVALGSPVSPAVPLFDFAPAVTYRGTGNPSGPPCPTTCTDFGWEIDPAGFRQVIDEAAHYGRPIYVTENGIDDPEDDQRGAYLRGYLGALHDAIAAGADVRGYFHWSLLDNYEWAEGFAAHFGLYAFDRRTLQRTERPSARLFRRIARTNALP